MADSRNSEVILDPWGDLDPDFDDAPPPPVASKPPQAQTPPPPPPLAPKTPPSLRPPQQAPPSPPPPAVMAARAQEDAARREIESLRLELADARETAANALDKYQKADKRARVWHDEVVQGRALLTEAENRAAAEKQFRVRAESVAHDAQAQAVNLKQAYENQFTELTLTRQDIAALHQELERVTRKSEAAAEREIALHEVAEKESATARDAQEEAQQWQTRCQEYEREFRQRDEAAKSARAPTGAVKPSPPQPRTAFTRVAATPPAPSPWGGQAHEAPAPAPRKTTEFPLPSNSIFFRDDPEPAPVAEASTPETSASAPASRETRNRLVGPAFGGNASAGADPA